MLDFHSINTPSYYHAIPDIAKVDWVAEWRREVPLWKIRGWHCFVGLAASTALLISWVHPERKVKAKKHQHQQIADCSISITTAEQAVLYTTSTSCDSPLRPVPHHRLATRTTQLPPLKTSTLFQVTIPQ